MLQCPVVSIRQLNACAHVRVRVCARAHTYTSSEKVTRVHTETRKQHKGAALRRDAANLRLLITRNACTIYHILCVSVRVTTSWGSAHSNDLRQPHMFVPTIPVQPPSPLEAKLELFCFEITHN